jgi:sugar transferase (PEP-CTERM system associated)
MQVFNRYISRRHVTFFIGEGLLIFGSMVLVALVYPPSDDISDALWKGGVVTLLSLFCLYYNDLYDLTAVRTGRELFIRLLRAVGVTLIFTALLYRMLPSLVLANGAFLPAAGLFLFAILAWRLAWDRVATLEGFTERMLIVGTDLTAQTLARQILRQRDFPYQIVGFIDDDPARIGQSLVNPSIVGTPADIEGLVASQGVNRIVVAVSDRRGRLPVEPLLRAKMQGVRVEAVDTVYERLTGKLLVEDLRPSALIFSDGFRASRWTRRTKRVFDIVLALIGGLLGAPLMALTALAVWLESGSPVLYRQERVGENGRVFTLFKFRSMSRNAEEGTPIWATTEDQRVTPVGRFIRMTHLDELPQLWNVFRGDMSFVGPRPERPFFVAQLSQQMPFYLQRHAVKPGLTGWAQVKYRYGASVEDALEKLRYDLYYVKHLSLFFDMSILVDTVKVVLFAKGAR